MGGVYANCYLADQYENFLLVNIRIGTGTYQYVDAWQAATQFPLGQAHEENQDASFGPIIVSILPEYN